MDRRTGRTHNERSLVVDRRPSYLEDSLTKFYSLWRGVKERTDVKILRTLRIVGVPHSHDEHTWNSTLRPRGSPLREEGAPESTAFQFASLCHPGNREENARATRVYLRSPSLPFPKSHEPMAVHTPPTS